MTKTFNEKLIEHVTSCNVVKNNVIFDGDCLKCRSCNIAYSAGSKTFHRDFVRHCNGPIHTGKNFWRVERDISNPVGAFKTICDSPILRCLSKITNSGPGQSQTLQEDIRLDSEQAEESIFVAATSISPPDVAQAASSHSLSVEASTPMVNSVRTQTIVTIDNKGQGDNNFELNLRQLMVSIGFDLHEDFSSASLQTYFQNHPTAREFVQNGLSRINKQSRHSNFVKEFTVAHGLKHSLSSALQWSTALGGPKKTTIKNLCVPPVRILPYLERANLKAHFDTFKDILRKYHNITDFSTIPVQASIDATATTGRLGSRDGIGPCDSGRVLYGLNTRSPLQQTFINHAAVENEPDVVANKSLIRLNGMENVLQLLEDNRISRAKSYSCVVLLALIPNSRPYCCGMYSVGPGSDANTLSTAHQIILEVAKECGFKLVTLPGDGDSTLRNLQWGTYTADRGYHWLKSLYIPLDLFYNSNGQDFQFPLQDVFHNIKKGRNNMKYLATRVLALGIDKDMEDKFAIRWDMVYRLFIDHPEVMVHSSLSALNVTDKQDPSLVTDISCLHEYFTEHGYLACGMYLKAVHFLMEAYMNKELSPYERAYKAWWTKSFFVVWRGNVTHPSQFVSGQTYHDILCSCDGLVLYLEMLRRKFPDCEVVAYYLGSDQNEQAYAFVRVSLSSGRRSHLDSTTLAYGLEKRNVTSGLSLSDDLSSVAHTRGRTVMRPAVPILKKSKPDKQSRSTVKVWKGKDIELGKLQEALQAASKDCIAEGKRHKLPVFLKEYRPEDRFGRRKSLICDDPSDSDSDDEDEGDDLVRDVEDEVEQQPCSSTTLVETTIFGKINARTAENLLLNGGRSRLKGSSREAKFTDDSFGVASDIRMFRLTACSCKQMITKGLILTLTTFSDSSKSVRGEVRFISYKNAPLQFYCKAHSPIKSRTSGGVTVWLLVNKLYIRCIV